MKKFSLLISILLLLITYNQVQAMSGSSKSSKYQIKQQKGIGNVEVIKNFTVPQLNSSKDIWVYLPPNYEQTNKRYPVLYLPDGQKMFNNSKWQAAEEVEKLIKEGKSSGVIMVGIEADNPHKECVAWKYTTGKKYIKNYQGDQYAQFIVGNLKPYIDQHYRTLKDRQHTAVLGSDFSGLFALYLGIRYQHVFSKVAARSPALWAYYYGQEFKENKFKVGKVKEIKFYLLSGRQEADNPAWNAVIRYNIKKFHSLLQKKGFKDTKLVFTEEKEKSQFTKAFLWLY